MKEDSNEHLRVRTAGCVAQWREDSRECGAVKKDSEYHSTVKGGC